MLGPWEPPYPPGAEQPLVLSALRGLVTGDPHDASADAAVRGLLLQVVEERLRRALPVVVVAPLLGRALRDPLLARVRAHHGAIAVIGLEPDRRDQALGSELDELARRKAVRAFHRLRAPPVALQWTPPDCDQRQLGGPFDLIGDLHGCAGELRELLARLGWEETGGRWAHPQGRTLVFLGDLVDRGPRILETLTLVMDLCAQGAALCVVGNHDDKLRRHLEGKRVNPSHGLQRTLDELAALDEPARAALVARTLAFLAERPDHLVLDGGRLVAVHGGLREDMIGRVGGEVRAFALYGDTTGETDARGYPVRRDWAARYGGAARVVYGHTPAPEPVWVNGTIDIDQGCVFGGALTALRWPEAVTVQVQARTLHWPREPGPDVDSAPHTEDDA